MTNQEILAAMAKQFMEPQITKRIKWVQVDTQDEGLVSCPLEDWDGVVPEDATVISGYGARLSAPGYMDCTEWSVFPTVAEAEQYLVDTYGDDIEEED